MINLDKLTPYKFDVYTPLLKNASKISSIVTELDDSIYQRAESLGEKKTEGNRQLLISCDIVFS